MLFQNPSPTAPISSRLAHISSSASARAFGSNGGGGGVGGGSGGGGGDGGSNGGGSEARSVGGEADEVSALSPDVIILDVGVSNRSSVFRSPRARARLFALQYI